MNLNIIKGIQLRMREYPDTKWDSVAEKAFVEHMDREQERSRRKVVDIIKAEKISRDEYCTELEGTGIKAVSVIESRDGCSAVVLIYLYKFKEPVRLELNPFEPKEVARLVKAVEARNE